MKFIAEDAMSDGYMDLQIKDIDYYEVRMDDPEYIFQKLRNFQNTKKDLMSFTALQLWECV